MYRPQAENVPADDAAVDAESDEEAAKAAETDAPSENTAEAADSEKGAASGTPEDTVAGVEEPTERNAALGVPLTELVHSWVVRLDIAKLVLDTVIVKPLLCLAARGTLGIADKQHGFPSHRICLVSFYKSHGVSFDRPIDSSLRHVSFTPCCCAGQQQNNVVCLLTI